MENFKPQPFEERKSQKLNFLDYAKDRLFWVALPFATAGAAMLFGKLTKFKVFPLDGSPDLLSTMYAKGTRFIANKHNIEGAEEAEQWLKKGAFAGDFIEQFGGEKKETLRKYYFNFVKGAEVATPFSAYFLWHKKEGNRLDLEDAGNKLKSLQTLKPTDAELAIHNEAMRRELEFSANPPHAATPAHTPAATIAQIGVEHHGKVIEHQYERVK